MYRIFSKSRKCKQAHEPACSQISSSSSSSSQSESDDMPRRSTTKKQVLFQDDVDVCRFDCHDGAILGSEQEGLSRSSMLDYNPGYTLRQSFILREFGPELTDSDLMFLENQSVEFGLQPEEYPRPPQPPSRLTVPLFQQDGSARHRIIKDKLRGNVLLFCVTLGSGYDPSSVMVKVNNSGKKIRVVACSCRVSPVHGGTASVRQEYNNRFVLPHAIDSERMQIRVDPQGNLQIEAALLSAC
jgi:hypothetical protein